VGDRDLHRPLHLQEGAGFDLPHALARDTELGRNIPVACPIVWY
jgi:hypothetical protein